MPRFSFAVPVLPGKDPRAVSRILEGRMPEFEESRRRIGVTMERAWAQTTPMGTFVVAYLESEQGFAETMQGLATSDLAIDREFMAGLQDVHGFDPSAMAGAPVPEVIAEWWDDAVTERRAGLGFCAPLIPGRTDAARAFGREAFVERVGEFGESRRALGENGELVFLNSTPQGDIVCVYLEGRDPAEANRRHSASTSAYDTWFRQQLTTIFPPQIDFSQPVPGLSTIWDWHRETARA